MGTRDSFLGGVGWGLVGKKWYRLFLVGGPGEPGGRKVLQSAPEPEHQA